MDYLSATWVGIIGFVILMYVILDGFDLGVGIIAPFFDAKDRDVMISTILPVWDGNETWLVMGGAMLYGAFPLAFSLILPTLYLPILVMVAALLFRGVSFEFRLKTDTSNRLWDFMFSFGSIVATLMQGLMLGTFVQGFNVTPGDIRQLVVPGYFWFSPFSVTCAVALLFGYALLGSSWLISKTQNHIQQKCFSSAKICLLVIAVFAVVVSFWTPFVDPHVKARWLDPDLMMYLAILPALSIVSWFWAWFSIEKKKDHSPFWAAVAIFLCCYAGFVIGAWPYIVPHQITFWDAAAPPQSLKFMLYGTAIMLPILLWYTFHAYRIFRGKVTDVIKY